MRILKIFKGKPLKRLELKAHSKNSKIRLRASRTGKAQASYHPTQGLTFSTRYGVRFSKTFKGLTLGIQGTKTILRGRWSSKKGLLNLNLSKSGFSLSSSNKLGAYNWSRPNYSSFKFAGLQLRGKKAASIAFWFVAIPTLIIGTIKLILWFIGLVFNLIKFFTYLIFLLLKLTLATSWILVSIICVLSELIDELIWLLFSFTDDYGRRQHITIGHITSLIAKSLKFFLL